MHLYSDYMHLSHRIRFAMAEKDAEFEITYVESEEHMVELGLAEMSPYGSLPVLRNREKTVLYDAAVIMEYMEERFPYPPMMPIYPAEKAECRQMIQRIDRDLGNHCGIMLSKGVRQSQKQKARKEFQENLWSLLRVFSEQEWYMSDEFSMLDCCIAPLLWRLPQMNIPVRESNYTRPLLRYMKRVFSREKFVATLSEKERNIRLP